MRVWNELSSYLLFLFDSDVNLLLQGSDSVLPQLLILRETLVQLQEKLYNNTLQGIR